MAVEGTAELIREKSAFQEHWTSDLDEWFEAPDIDIIILNNLAEIIIIRT